MLQNYHWRNMKRKFLTWFLTLPKSSVKVDSSETWTLSKRGCAVFSILLQNHPHAEKHEEKISNIISYTVQVKCESWLEWDLNAIQARMCSVSILLQNHPQRNMKRKFLTWFLTLPKSRVKVDSSETWTLSKRGCTVFRFYYRTILRETWRENF